MWVSEGARSGTGARGEARWFFRTEGDGRPGCCPGSSTAQAGGRELRARIPGSAHWGTKKKSHSFRDAESVERVGVEDKQFER